jgi:dihydrodipicolinate synthase/N-acetylneuraminate lyase
MKAAMAAAGIFDRATVRPPTIAPSPAELTRIAAAVENAGLARRPAA